MKINYKLLEEVQNEVSVKNGQNYWTDLDPRFIDNCWYEVIELYVERILDNEI